MSVVELSDEVNVVILAQTFTDSLADLDDRPRQMAVLKRIYELLDSSAPQPYIYETVQGCDELEVIRVGGDRRIFCRLVMGIPKGDKEYNVLYSYLQSRFVILGDVCFHVFAEFLRVRFAEIAFRRD